MKYVLLQHGLAIKWVCKEWSCTLNIEKQLCLCWFIYNCWCNCIFGDWNPTLPTKNPICFAWVSAIEWVNRIRIWTLNIGQHLWLCRSTLKWWCVCISSKMCVAAMNYQLKWWACKIKQRRVHIRSRNSVTCFHYKCLCIGSNHCHEIEGINPTMFWYILYVSTNSDGCSSNTSARWKYIKMTAQCGNELIYRIKSQFIKVSRPAIFVCGCILYLYRIHTDA